LGPKPPVHRTTRHREVRGKPPDGADETSDRTAESRRKNKAFQRLYREDPTNKA